MSRRFRTIYRDEALECATWGGLFVQRWLGGDARAEHVEAMLALHTRFVEEAPRGSTMSLSHIARPDLRPPDERMRAAMRRHMQMVERSLAAATTVIGVSGFASAMARSILSGLLLLSRPKCPHAVVGTTREGFAFLLRHGSLAGVSADELDAAYHRELLDAP